ncbi:hypothetical protein IFM89_004284 [Coptis chinensis]|uniref:Ribosomal RNA-processing protein 17 n=1 Tax=Coptis chinensis TaxID=261450 RepID=A0A835IBL2_9MAGN|nr:hypothetical protein IFM89_004284 [Coptis chinensis]
MGKKEVEEAEAAIGLGPVNSRHIKKRALRNKALAISFNDKDLKDYVGGFHKRKKKRRKEAQQQIAEKDRLKRIEKRKQRKREREYVQGGGAGGSSGEADENAGDLHQDEETPVTVDFFTVINSYIFISFAMEATKMYDAGNLTVMVTTSEISREEEDKQKTERIPRSSGETEKKQRIPVNKKQQSKTTSKHRSVSRLQKKRDKKKGPKKRTTR